MCLILKCPECDNKFEPDKNKCKDISSGRYFDGEYTHYYCNYVVNCPKCNSEIDFEESD